LREEEHRHKQDKGRRPPAIDWKGPVTIDDDILGLFCDSHNLAGWTPPERQGACITCNSDSPEEHYIYSVGAAVLGPSRHPSASGLYWKRDAEGDWLVQSCLGWPPPPYWRSDVHTLSSLGEIAYTMLPGKQLAHCGRLLLKILRHTEISDAVAFCEIEVLARKAGMPLYQVLSTALFNFDVVDKVFRFEIHFEGGLARHRALWQMASGNAPRHRSVSCHVRARSKHTIDVGA
jgi:hypothetical protein